jgi:hypothetical protein
MNKEKVQQQIKEAFDNLPSVLQNAILNSDIKGKLQQVSEKHKLHFDK